MPSVAGQTGFDLFEAFAVALEVPVGEGGVVDEHAGDFIAFVGLVVIEPGLDGEFEFGGIFVGQDGYLGAAAVSEAVHARAGFAVGSFRAGRAVARFFGAQRLDVLRIFFGDELVHRHGCDNELGAMECGKPDETEASC